MDSKVNEFIDKQEPSKKEICLKLREIILRTFPKISEEMKWGVPYGGGKFYIGAVKLGVNLGFSMTGLTEKEMDNFSGKGKMMRHIVWGTPVLIGAWMVFPMIPKANKEQA